MKAVVDQETCISCGICVQTCPDVFKMADDKAVAYVESVPDGMGDLCRQAVEECPVTAISINE